jgi:hypothetical protein
MRIGIILYLLSGFLLTGNPTPLEIFPDFEKKIQKLADKQWKNITVKIKEINLGETSRRVLEGRKIYALTTGDSTLGFVVVNKALGCHVGGCDSPTSSLEESIDNSYEKFYYAVLYNVNFNIEEVKVLQYDSDFGYEICGKRWLRQFKGHKGCELQYEKQIDGITGATVSVKSITSDINNLCWIIDDLKDELLKGL